MVKFITLRDGTMVNLRYVKKVWFKTDTYDSYNKREEYYILLDNEIIPITESTYQLVKTLTIN